VSDYVSATRNRALRLLAEHPNGCTGAVLLAHGFSLELLNELIGAGLATASTESMMRGSNSGVAEQNAPAAFPEALRGIPEAGRAA